MEIIPDLPEKYRVNKKLGKERFLRLGNLSPSEKKYLGTYAKNIDILYDIRFSGASEMVVIYTEVEAPVLQKRYFCSNYTKAIAQSIPYHCLIILRCKSIVKYFAFEKRPNKENTSRMLVTECYATDELNDFNRYDYIRNRKMHKYPHLC